MSCFLLVVKHMLCWKGIPISCILYPFSKSDTNLITEKANRDMGVDFKVIYNNKSSKIR